MVRRRIHEPEWPSEAGYVYFIQSGASDGPVKIGWTRKPRTRLSALRTGNPEPLTLLAAVPGSKAMERRLHRELSYYRIRRTGEWFVSCHELLATLVQACDQADHVLVMDAFDDQPSLMLAPCRPLRTVLTTREALDIAVRRAALRELRMLRGERPS